MSARVIVCTMTTTTISTAAPVRAEPRYVTSIAGSTEQVRAAQRLRYRVFAEEQGARLTTSVPGHDADPWDAAADHLLVTEAVTGEVVGTYRLLPPGRDSYGQTEFELATLPEDVRSSMVEMGRACVHPDHRTGTVINQMWSGIARYVLLSGHRYLAGCASVSLADGEGAAAAAYALGSERYAAPSRLTVRPLTPWTPAEAATSARLADLPPLLRSYLRLGAWICGEPHYDPAFGTVDFFVMLDLEGIDDRYRRYFLEDGR